MPLGKLEMHKDFQLLSARGDAAPTCLAPAEVMWSESGVCA